MCNMLLVNNLNKLKRRGLLNLDVIMQNYMITIVLKDTGVTVLVLWAVFEQLATVG